MLTYLPLPERLLWIAREVDRLVALTGPNAPPGLVEAFERGEYWAELASRDIESALENIDSALYPRPLVGRKSPIGDWDRQWLISDCHGWSDTVKAALNRLDVMLTDLLTRWEMLDSDLLLRRRWGFPRDDDDWPVVATLGSDEHQGLLWISRTLSRGVADLPCPEPAGWLAISGETRDISLREKALRERLWEEAEEAEESSQLEAQTLRQLRLANAGEPGFIRCSKEAVARALGRKPSDIAYVDKLVEEERLICTETTVKRKGHFLYDFRFTASGLAYLRKYPRKKQGVLALMVECRKSGLLSDYPSDNPDPGE